MIKLISLDLDGTLLDNERRLPERNRKALESANRDGIRIIISTGSPYGLMPFAELEGVDISYTITANGSAIYEYKTGKRIYEESIDTYTILPILTYLLSKDMHIDMFMDGKGYCPSNTKSIIDKLDVPKARKDYILSNRIWLDDPVGYIKEYGLSMQKITMNFYPDYKGELIDRAEVKDYLEKNTKINLVSGGWGNLELTKSGVNKGKALKKLCEILNICVDNTVAMGDSINDLDIIKTAGIGVAMENAMQEVLQAADYVTASNDACGVADVIESLIKGKEIA